MATSAGVPACGGGAVSFSADGSAADDEIAARLKPKDPDVARRDALTLFGLMVRALQLSRGLTDRDLSHQLLAQGVETTLKLLADRA